MNEKRYCLMIKFPYILVGGTGCYSCKVLYFDIATIIIQVVLLTSLIFRKMLSGRTNKFYALLLIHMHGKDKGCSAENFCHCDKVNTA